MCVCAADDVGILELRINESLWQVNRWLDRRCLIIVHEKTEALLVTDRRSFQYPRIVFGEHEVECKRSIKYLGVQLERRLSFGELLKIAAAKAIQFGANLARLMPNINGPRGAKRRLVASVVPSKLLNAAPVWVNALQNHANQRRLFSPQRSVALRIVSAHRTVSTSSVLVLASIPPIDLLTEERQETFQFGKELTYTDLQEIARAKEAIRKDGMRRLVERWTYHLILELAACLNREHGEVGFYLAQALPGHGCFNAYLKHFMKRGDEMCCYCDFLVDNAEHALFVFAKWGVAREALGQAVGAELTPDMMVSLTLQSEF